MRSRAWIAFVVGIASVLVAASPATAAITIVKIAFDPAGEDTGANWHLNKERILIKNTGDSHERIAGWKIVDGGRDHTFKFPRRLELFPGDRVYVHTGKDRGRVPGVCNGHCVYHLYWGLDNYVWDNNGDIAKLKKPDGSIVDRCRYISTADSPARC